MRVIVVDDSNIVRSRLIRMFSAEGDVDVMGLTGDEEIDFIEKFNPDLVVLDIKLNNRSGVDILKSIKATSPGTIVAMLTNYYDQYYLNRCKELGADYFFDKSMDFEKLADLINDFRNIH
ncbi:MAG: response regulator transcription factor [Spirochaetota bacterium]